MQRFLAQNIFEDGQASAGGRPDRAESDDGDNEISDADDEDTQARTTDLGMGYKQPGTPDSLKEFLAAGDDTATSPAATLDADAPPAPKPTAPAKRPRDEAGSVGEGTSRQQVGKGHGPSKKAKAKPAMARLEEAPLDIPPLRFMMPKFPVMAG